MSRRTTFGNYRCEDGRSMRHAPQPDDPYLEVDVGQCEECDGKGCDKMRKIFCIYHGKCADGFTAAWAVYRAMGEDNVEFYPGVYGQEPPDVTGRDVLLVDFSYKKPILLAMAAKANSVLILDHHKTAAEDLADIPHSTHSIYSPIPGISKIFDMGRSGAGITWDFFHQDEDRPNLVNYVEDRDLWRFKLPLSREINAYIFAHDYTFENWDGLDAEMREDSGAHHVADMGAAIEKKHHKDVAELVDVCKRRLKIGGVEVWAANIPYTLTSDAGNLMAQGEPFAACYWDTPKDRVFSLRSTQDGSDVSTIAAGYGGGGHKNASGFQVPLNAIEQFELP